MGGEDAAARPRSSEPARLEAGAVEDVEQTSAEAEEEQAPPLGGRDQAGIDVERRQRADHGLPLGGVAKEPPRKTLVLQFSSV